MPISHTLNHLKTWNDIWYEKIHITKKKQTLICLSYFLKFRQAQTYLHSMKKIFFQAVLSPYSRFE